MFLILNHNVFFDCEVGDILIKSKKTTNKRTFWRNDNHEQVVDSGINDSFETWVVKRRRLENALTSEIRSDQKEEEEGKEEEETVFWKKAILDFCEICPNRVAMFEEIYFLMKVINGWIECVDIWIDDLSVLYFWY